MIEAMQNRNKLETGEKSLNRRNSTLQEKGNF